jgi:excinuclease ABC subunit A
MFAADRILDMGPGPGERGGEIVCFDTPAALVRAERSLTADYLSGRKRARGVGTPASDAPPVAAQRIELAGVTEHNLKIQVDLRRGLGFTHRGMDVAATVQ